MYTVRKQFSKRIVALVLTLTIIVSACTALLMINATADGAVAPAFAVDTVLNVDKCNNKTQSDADYGVFDFETAMVSGVSQNNVKLLFGDFMPKSESGNSVMYYKGTNYGFGLVHLGVQYNSIANKTIATTHIKNAIAAQKGAAYKIEYELSVKAGTASSGLEIGVGVGKAGYSSISNNPTLSTMVKCAKADVTYSGGSISAVNKEKRTVYYTLADDASFSGDFKYLTIYVKGTKNSNVEVRIDNVKVTGLAPVDVSFVIDNKTIDKRYYDGVITEPTELSTPSRAAHWFSDAEMTVPYDFSSYVRTGVYSSTATVIYGYYDRFKYDTDTVLFDYGYEDAATKANIKSSIADGVPSLSDIVVSKDPTDDTNTTLRYSQHRIGLGVVQLGHKYTATTLNADDKIEVYAGSAYKISFDYMVKGEVKNSALNIGVSVGATAYGYGWPQGVSQTNFLNENVAIYEAFAAYGVGEKPDTGWLHADIVFEVPEDCDTSIYNALQLYCTNGSPSVSVYFDNIKVVGLAPVDVEYEIDGVSETVRYADGNIKDYQKTDAYGQISTWYTDPSLDEQYKFDYTAYTRTGTYAEIKLYGKWQAFSYAADTVLFDYGYENSDTKANIKTGINQAPPSNSDLIVTKDPVDDTNTVLRYSQHRIGLGVVQLGYTYGAAAISNDDRVKVNAGVTYKISFDYLVKGTPTNSQLKIGVAVGATTYGYGWPEGVSQTNYLTQNVAMYQDILVFASGEAVDTGWKSAEIYFSVPTNCDLSVYDALQLYGISGSPKVSAYFDNIKVVGLATREYTVNFDTNGGSAIAQAKLDLLGLNNLPTPTRDDGYFLGWYSDSGLNTPFEVNAFVEATAPITVYAKWHLYTNGAIITVDDHSFWRNANGAYLNVPAAYTVENVDGNNVVRYFAGKSPDKKHYESHQYRGNYLTPVDDYPQVINLFDPDVTVGGKYDYEKALRKAEKGKTYRISFKYKVLSAETQIGFSVQTAVYRNTTANRVSQASVCTEDAPTDWKTVSAYFTVKNIGDDFTISGTKYAADNIGIGIYGRGEVLIDDISLMDWDESDATYIIFATRGGDKLEGGEYYINASTVLPKAVRKGYTFDKWYLDAKCTNPFNPATYKRENGRITLYAGYVEDYGQTVIDFNVLNFYKSGTNRSGQRLGAPLTYETDGGNNFLRYKLRFSNTERIEKPGNCIGNYGAYGATIGLFDPNVYEDKNATYADAEYIVKEGEAYFITLRYKTVGLETGGDGTKSMKIGVGATARNSIFSDRSSFATFSPTMTETSGEWQTAKVACNVSKLVGKGDRLSLFVSGYGEMLIDDIVITRIENGFMFDTLGGEYVDPIVGKVGAPYALPKEAKKDGCKFLGWYSDQTYKTPVATSGKISKGVTMVYPKYLQYQYVQSFEPDTYFRYKSDGFEHDYWLNTPIVPSKDCDWYQWKGNDHVPEGVRTGKVSVFRTSAAQYERLFSLFSLNGYDQPLVVGEEYTLSFWVKVTEYFMDGNFTIWFNNGRKLLRTPENWSSKDGARFETIINSAMFEDYMDDWVEIKYDFTARGQYIGIGTPGLTAMYIDDAVITLKSADESYKRSIEGAGTKFEDWYKDAPVDDGSNQITKVQKIIIKPAEFEDTGMPVFGWIIIAVGAAVICAGVVIAILLVKKRSRRRGQV